MFEFEAATRGGLLMPSSTQMVDAESSKREAGECRCDESARGGAPPSLAGGGCKGGRHRRRPGSKGWPRDASRRRCHRGTSICQGGRQAG